MSAAMDKILRQATFFYPCRGVELIGGTPYMMDAGPHGLHAEMVGFAAPSYGVVTLPNGRPAISFAGQYARLPLRFYADAPTEEMTIVIFARHTAPASSARIFFGRDAAATRGVSFQVFPGDITRCSLSAYPGSISVSDPAASTSYASRTKVSIFGGDLANGRVWQNRVQTYGAVLASAACAYDTTVVPSIGAGTGGAGPQWVGTLAGLGLFPWLFTDREAKDITDMLVDGVL